MRRRRLSKERISVTVRLLLTGTLLSAHHAQRGSDPLKQSLTKGYVGEGRHGRLASASWPRLVQLIEAGVISGKIAKEILPELLEQGGSAKAIVEQRGLGMISDPAAITAVVAELLAAHPAEVEAFRGGKTKLQGFFVGQLMKRTGGKVDPKLANQILNQMLGG